MPLVPHRFLLRVAYPCRQAPNIPCEDEDPLLDLDASCRIDNFAGMDEQTNFADVRLAWNEQGIGFQVEVRGREGSLHDDGQAGGNGISLWIDTRDARTSHRASRYCHQFHFLPSGGGADRDEPSFSQSKINRALNDAPLCEPNSVPFRIALRKTGYLLEAFLPAGVLNGFDPEQHPRLGFYYAVRDAELGEQFLGVGSEFPYWEDPSLWSVLELKK